MTRRVFDIFIVFAMCGLILSCNNGKTNGKSSSNEVILTNYSDSVRLEPSPTSKKELPPPLCYGKVIEPTFPDSMKAERNVLSQVATYHSALLHGDVETCASYLYPDAFEYCRSFYPDFPDDQVIREFFKDISSGLQEAMKGWAKKGIEPKIVVPNFERKIQVGNDIIIVYNVTLSLCSENVFIHSTELDKTIAISHNAGINWWFMNNHEDLPTILRKRYSQEVVNAVMGY